MGFVSRTRAQVRVMPKAVWVVAIVVPFGLVAIGTWIAGKSFYDTHRKRKQ